MILMALDHVREFVHSGSASFSPEDLSRTTAVLFFTRWITHFCAPAFMFTAGLGAFLWARTKTKAELSRFLLTRGLWLIFLELTVVRLALYFNFDYSVVLLSVLWALGWSMVALAVLVYLPSGVLIGLSLGIIALHNLADGVNAAQFGSAGLIWNVLHQPGLAPAGSRMILVAYPLIPWIAVMAAGYYCGRVFLIESPRRRRILVRLGIILTIGFVVLRVVNIYGDPMPWSKQHSAVFTVLSFLKCTKYPPSLDFLLMTLGPSLLALGLLERVRLSAMNPFVIFGRVPQFYFIVHLFLIHGAAALLAYLHYGTSDYFTNPPPSMRFSRDAASAIFGFDLWVCYAFWLTLLILLYPLCRWFAGLKQRRRDWWLSYL